MTNSHPPHRLTQDELNLLASLRQARPAKKPRHLRELARQVDPGVAVDELHIVIGSDQYWCGQR